MLELQQDRAGKAVRGGANMPADTMHEGERNQIHKCRLKIRRLAPVLLRPDHMRAEQDGRHGR